MIFVATPGALPVNVGARRPENLVTARSKLPQKRCTGLHLPRKPVRKCLNTRSHLQQRAPEAMRIFRVIRGVLAVDGEADGVRDLARTVV
jgi:hypothetical protein